SPPVVSSGHGPSVAGGLSATTGYLAGPTSSARPSAKPLEIPLRGGRRSRARPRRPGARAVRGGGLGKQRRPRPIHTRPPESTDTPRPPGASAAEPYLGDRVRLITAMDPDAGLAARRTGHPHAVRPASDQRGQAASRAPHTPGPPGPSNAPHHPRSDQLRTIHPLRAPVA